MIAKNPYLKIIFYCKENMCIAFLLHESSVPYKCLLLSREDVCCKKKKKNLCSPSQDCTLTYYKHFPCLFGKWLYCKILESRCLKESVNNLLTCITIVVMYCNCILYNIFYYAKIYYTKGLQYGVWLSDWQVM